MTTTDKIFTYALNQSMPEHGEGWELFADILHTKMSEMERLLRQVMPEWADEVTEDQRHKPVGEIIGKDVLEIRDFLANKEL
jgi:hypothetical protein